MKTVNKVWTYVKEYVVETASDFKSVWKIYPNVLIVSAIALLIAWFV